MNARIILARWMHAKGEMGERNTDSALVERCQSILRWKLLVNLVKDTVNRLHPQTTAMDFPEPSACACVCVYVCARQGVFLLVCHETMESKIQLPSHTGQSCLSPYQPTLPCERDKDSFCWRQKGPRATTRRAKEWAARTSQSICSSLFFFTFASCLLFFFSFLRHGKRNQLAIAEGGGGGGGKN